MIAPNNDYLFQPHTVAKTADGDIVELYGKSCLPALDQTAADCVGPGFAPTYPIKGMNIESVPGASRSRPAVSTRKPRRLTGIFGPDEHGCVWLFPAVVCLALLAILIPLAWWLLRGGAR